jgi:CSLREA domain-containing protein
VRKLVSKVLSVALLVGGLSAVGTDVNALSITVTTTKDVVAEDRRCSLREAIDAANANGLSSPSRGECKGDSGPDVIKLGKKKTYALSLDGIDEDGNEFGDLDITSELTIVGGRGTTIRQEAPNNRVIDIRGAGDALIRSVTITGGEAPNGQPSAGLQNGAGGGGIRSVGHLTLDRVTVRNNFAGSGSPMQSGPSSGHGGNGGGIYNNGGSLTIRRSTITQNRAGFGGSGTAAAPQVPAGDGGSGGGVYSSIISALSVEDSVISANRAGHGGVGFDGNFTSGGGGTGGKAGIGGGIAVFTAFSIAGSTVTGNAAGNGGPGGNGYGAGAFPTTGGNGAHGGDAGGIYTSNWFSRIERTTVSHNAAGNGGDGGVGGAAVSGAGSRGGNGGLGGNGGGIAVDADGPITAITISGNVPGRGGDGGQGGAGGPQGATGTSPGGGSGGGLAVLNTSDVTATNSTISGNQALDGIGGGIFSGANLALNSVTVARNYADAGGGMFVGGLAVQLSNTIFADNATDDCSGAVVSNGRNVVKGSSCTGMLITDQPIDPELGPLASNGGPTKTHSIPANSIARDGAEAATCPPTDQRGVVRSACDVGAFEYVKPRRR